MLVNPPMDAVIAADDELIVLAEDDLLIRLTDSPPPVVSEAISTTAPGPAKPARTLLVGWNQRAPKIISLLDAFAQPGSTLDVAAPRDDPRERLAAPANLTMGFTRCDPTDRAALETLDSAPTSTSSCCPTTPTPRSTPTPARSSPCCTCGTWKSALGDPYSIVSEINDEGNREVAPSPRPTTSSSAPGSSACCSPS